MTVRRLATMLLASVGALVVHQLAYLTAHPEDAARQLALAGHAYLGPAASVLVPLAMVAGVAHVIGSARRSLGGRRASFRLLLAMQTALFFGQEVIERSGSLERTFAEPAMLIGLALQVPVAWLLVRAAGEIRKVIDRFVAVDDPATEWIRVEPRLPRPGRIDVSPESLIQLPVSRRGPPLVA